MEFSNTRVQMFEKITVLKILQSSFENIYADFLFKFTKQGSVKNALLEILWMFPEYPWTPLQMQHYSNF